MPRPVASAHRRPEKDPHRRPAVPAEQPAEWGGARGQRLPKRRPGNGHRASPGGVWLSHPPTHPAGCSSDPARLARTAQPCRPHHPRARECAAPRAAPLSGDEPVVVAAADVLASRQRDTWIRDGGSDTQTPTRGGAGGRVAPARKNKQKEQKLWLELGRKLETEINRL